MTETILRLLTRLSEAGDDAILPGELAAPFFGPVFDRLLAKRVLVEQAPLADWDVCDACECGLPCRPIRKAGDAFRAECPLDHRQDIELTEDDVRVFRIGADGLASVICAAAGFAAAPKRAAGKVWRLGDTPSGRAVFLSLEPAAMSGDGIIASLRQAAQGADVTILAPQLPAEAARRHQDAGFHLVETLAVLMPASDGLGAAIDVAALAPIPLAEVLRVRRTTAEVQWGGRSVILSRQIFPVFERLLEKALSRDQVATGSHVEGTTAREAKDLIRELRDAFKAAGFTDAESKSLIVTVRNRGYRLGIPAKEIVVEG
ncbi:MAG: hypothetical protein V2I43_05150 [Parvularcula sp.]|jgi:hypothetical protein|uniref:OmpR/PhoB-type domain-containing protein n=1 Tax=Palleronia sediminis TaxID=2547833 RepID=A0A4R6AKD7_9RHOB|nr:hypothetical protein [Palleronia sediminis]MEE4208634.1 hypothetical protein [Parvularcula sp.]TDL84057.1 hypothetical protein E2L08_00875 [Palleronia sediminis]